MTSSRSLRDQIDEAMGSAPTAKSTHEKFVGHQFVVDREFVIGFSRENYKNIPEDASLVDITDLKEIEFAINVELQGPRFNSNMNIRYYDKSDRDIDWNDFLNWYMEMEENNEKAQS